MTFRLTLACNRAEAEALPDAGGLFEDLAQPPTLLVDEPDPDRPDAWLLHAYFEAEPDAALLDRVRALAPSAGAGGALVRLDDEDWTTLSQQGLEPVRAGRFLVHNRDHRATRRNGNIAIEIEAGLAFGTGQHATTLGCLAALDRLARRRSFRRIADLGTGTAVLALAASRRWPKAHVIASDIDPVAITVARANLAGNRRRPGRRAAAIELVVAAGMHHHRLRDAAPYDLLLANILAAPLVAISRDAARTVAPGGVVVLAGLLQSQARRVRAAWRRFGLLPVAPIPRGEWPVLVLRRPGSGVSPHRNVERR